MLKTIFCSILFLSLSIIFFSCQKDEAIIDTANYPREVGKILVGKCATSGCHNDASYKIAAGLNLTTWSDLMKGSNVLCT